MIENLKNQHVHYEKHNKLRQEKSMWKTIALLAIITTIFSIFTIDIFEKDLKKTKESEYVYQIGLETIKKNQFNDSIARNNADSTYWIYLKTKRMGRN